MHSTVKRGNFKWTHYRAAGLVCGVMFFGTIALAAPPLPPVSISVSQSTAAGSVFYRYQVVNHGSYPITAVVIGLNYYTGRSELQTAPVGWSVSGGIPSSSVVSPIGWTANVVPTEDTNLLQLVWTASDPSLAIAPGQTLQGFGVLIPAADVSYAGSDWTVYVNGPGTNYYTGLLGTAPIPCDNPRLSVSLSPNILWPPNHKLVTIRASLSAQDDNYPNPVTRLVSITATEILNTGDVVAQFGTAAQTFSVRSERKGTDKAGRVYTVTYSTTNSCGNSSTASETITVPHDQGMSP